jgi:hypothetical protein
MGDTLAVALEGDVRSISSFLRIFDASCLRIFLKFELFPSLKISCRDARNPRRCLIAREPIAASRSRLCGIPSHRVRLGCAPSGRVWQPTVHHAGRKVAEGAASAWRAYGFRYREQPP